MVALILGIPADILLILVMMGFPLGLLGFLVWRDAKDAKKAIVLFFQSEKQAFFMDKAVKEGMVEMGKRRFYVDEEHAPSVSSGFLVRSFRPLYAIKWDSSLPLKFTQKGMKFMSPSNLKNFMDNKALDQLLTPKGSDKMFIVALIIGGLMGGLVGYFVARGVN